MSVEQRAEELIAGVRGAESVDPYKSRPEIVYSVMLDRLQAMEPSKIRKPGAMAEQLAAIADIEAELARLKKGLKERMSQHVGLYGRVTVSKPAKTRAVDHAKLWTFLAKNHPAMLPIVFDKASLSSVDTISGAVPQVMRYVSESIGDSRVTVRKAN